MSAPVDPQFTWDTVAIPVARGLDLRTAARLVEPGALLEARNVTPEDGFGLVRRTGHLGEVPVTGFLATTGSEENHQAAADPVTPTPPRDLYQPVDQFHERWLYGHGLFATASETQLQLLDSIGAENNTVDYRHPQLGHLQGALRHGDAVSAWDGFRFTVRIPGTGEGYQQQAGFQTPLSGIFNLRPQVRAMPFLRTHRVPTSSSRGSDEGAVVRSVCGADNGRVRLTAWIGTEPGAFSTPRPWFRLEDSATGAQLPILSSFASLDTETDSLDALCTGDYIHVLAREATGTTLVVLTLDTRTLRWEVRDVGDAAASFHVRKVDETRFFVAVLDTAGAVQGYYLSADGLVQSTFTFDRGVADTVQRVSVAVNPRSGNLCLAWLNAANDIRARVYGPTGGPLFSVVPGTAVSSGQVISVESRYLAVEKSNAAAPRPTGEAYDIYCGSAVFTYIPAVENTKLLSTGTLEGRPVSHAFRVGQWTAIITCRFRDIQPVYLLWVTGVGIAGSWSYGAAVLGSGLALTSVNWRDGSGGSPKDRLVFHLPVPVARTIRETGFPDFLPVQTDPGILWCDLDFLPPLRTAKFGGCTYLPGALLWSYDGEHFSEALPLYAPGVIAVTSANMAGGALVPGNVHRYRVYAAWRNAAGEEVRSPALTSDPVTVGVGHNGVNIQHTGIVTNRPDLYYIIYRNENNGTNWYRVSDDLLAGSGSLLVKDGLADSALISREQDPANAGNYLMNFPAPACEVAAAGNDRLWLLGGEIEPSAVAPSKLWSQDQAPGFPGGLRQLVDTSPEPLTALGFLGTSTILFRRDRTYLLEGDGPSNTALGSWSPARLAYADTGALGPEGVVLTTRGLVFPSDFGLQVLSPSGLERVGGVLGGLPASARFSAAVLVPESRQLRMFTQAGPAFVMDLGTGEWYTWTGLECRSAVLGADGRVVLAGFRGRLLVESPGTWTDAGLRYEAVVRLSHLHAGALGDFQRVRRFGFLGHYRGAHEVRVRLFYDERPFHGDEFKWDPADDIVPGTWGEGTWGSGTWGDPLGARDLVWRATRRTGRQKCSVVSLEISDQGCESAGYALTAVTLQVGKLSGLDRVPWRTPS